MNKKKNKNTLLPFWIKSPRTALALLVLIGSVLAGITRLPQLMNPNLVLEGEEARLALTAKHVVEQNQWPNLFHIQESGFNVFETLAMALFFKMGGVSEVTVTGAMVFLWTLGLIFFILAQNRFSGFQSAWIAGIFFLFFPTWIPWSLSARQWVSPFFLAGFCCWLATHSPTNFFGKRLWGIGLGIATGGLFASRPLWGVCFLAFLAALFWKRGQWSDVLAILIGAVVAVSFLTSWAAPERTATGISEFFKNFDLALSLRQLPTRIFVAFTGAFEESLRFPIGRFTRWASIIWSGGVFLFLTRVVTARESFSDRRFAVGCALAIAIPVAFSLGVSPNLFSFQHLVALTPYAILGVSALGAQAWERQSKGSILIVLFLLATTVAGSGASFEAASPPRHQATPPFTLSVKEARAKLIKEIQDNDIHHVFSLDPIFRWNLIFDSGEKIIARWVNAKDPLPNYAKEVDKALFYGKPLALVGLTHQEAAINQAVKLNKLPSPEIHHIGNRYIWVKQPSQFLILAFDFEPNPLEDLDIPTDLIENFRKRQTAHQPKSPQGQIMDQATLKKIVQEGGF